MPEVFRLDLRALLEAQFGAADHDPRREAAIAEAGSWGVRDVWSRQQLPAGAVVGGVLTTDAVAPRDSRFYVLTPGEAPARPGPPGAFTWP